MKSHVARIVITLLLIFLPGCKQNGVPEPTPPAMDEGLALPPANGQSLQLYITQNNDYRQWPLFPGKDVLHPGKHPHGSLLITYVSPTTSKALEDTDGPLPDGAIIVKENYDRDKKLQTTTVMYRKAGYNPAAGDWFWLKYDRDQTILEEGKVDACIRCHRGVKNNDWIFSGPVQ
jgi:hypothetical protein